MLNVTERVASIIVRLLLITVIGAIMAALIGLLFLPGAVVVDDTMDFVGNDLLDVGPLPDVETPPENSFIYASTGAQLAEINFEENRQPVTLDAIPATLVNAVIATEDSSFYTHNGINPRSIVRAFIENTQSGDIESGASTITQQYVKNALLSERANEQSYERKLIEAVWAVDIEKVLTKDEILERYLNRTFFGSGAWGVETAAQRYFSKSVGELTLAESAMLAGLIRSPERNSPLVNTDNALARRNIVLNQMMLEGFITEAQRDSAMAEGLGIDESTLPPPVEPFWTEWVGRLLFDEEVAEALGSQTDALALMGETREERIQTVFQSGLRIHTTIRPDWQNIAREEINERLTYDGEPRDEIAQEPFGGLVTIEAGTGAIRTAAIGPYEYGSCEEDGDYAGVDEDTGEVLCDKTKVNPLVIGMGASGRQPGSSFKPFIVAAALESGLPPGYSIDADKTGPIEGCDEDYNPNNAGGGGIRDMYSGIKGSVNQYFAKLTRDIGPQTGADMADRLGLRTWGDAMLNEDGLYTRVGCSLGLGATDVSPLEMASGYATLANRGEYCAPYAIERIEDREGNVIYEHTPDCEQVVDTRIADRVQDILQGPVTGGGTAPYVAGDLGEYPVRGKTGTTDDSRDAWFAGYTAQLATAAWMGYGNGGTRYETVEQARAACPAYFETGAGIEDAENGRPLCPPATKLMENVSIGGESYRRVFGGTITGRVFADFMSRIQQEFEPESFTDPGPVPTATVPNVLGLSISGARAKALDAGFTLITKTVTDFRSAGTAIDQVPNGGSRAEAGSAIVLSISNGEGERPTVPNFIGEPIDNARRIAAAQGVGIEVFTRAVTNPGLVDVVIAQSPEGGAIQNSDTVVSVQVGVLVADEPDDDGGGNNGNGNGNGGSDEPTEPPPTDDPSEDDRR